MVTFRARGLSLTDLAIGSSIEQNGAEGNWLGRAAWLKRQLNSLVQNYQSRTGPAAGFMAAYRETGCAGREIITHENNCVAFYRAYSLRDGHCNRMTFGPYALRSRQELISAFHHEAVHALQDLEAPVTHATASNIRTDIILSPLGNIILKQIIEMDAYSAQVFLDLSFIIQEDGPIAALSALNDGLLLIFLAADRPEAPETQAEAVRFRECFLKTYGPETGDSPEKIYGMTIAPADFIRITGGSFEQVRTLLNQDKRRLANGLLAYADHMMKKELLSGTDRGKRLKYFYNQKSLAAYDVTLINRQLIRGSDNRTFIRFNPEEDLAFMARRKMPNIFQAGGERLRDITYRSSVIAPDIEQKVAIINAELGIKDEGELPTLTEVLASRGRTPEEFLEISRASRTLTPALSYTNGKPLAPGLIPA
jgi:hypothetical protein